MFYEGFKDELLKLAVSRYEMNAKSDRGSRYTSGKAVRSRREPRWGKGLTAKERFVLSRTLAKKASSLIKQEKRNGKAD
jgi:hypothetical protein